MKRIKSFSMSRFSPTKHDAEIPPSDQTSRTTDHYTTQYADAHSSSTSSFASTLISPVYPNRVCHQRWPSSSSTLATSPDSPVIGMTKPTLHDLAEEPFENASPPIHEYVPTVDDELHDDRGLCICDKVLCEHQYVRSTSQRPSAAFSREREWLAGDDSWSHVSGYTPEPPLKRRRSRNLSHTDGPITRLSRHFSSLSRRQRNLNSVPTSPIDVPDRSSRVSSVNLTASRRLNMAQSERGSNSSLALPPRSESIPDHGVMIPRRTVSLAADPMDIDMPTQVEDPIDRAHLSSTPLLPPTMDDRRVRSAEELDLVSPLQSPAVAEIAAPVKTMSTPLLHSYPTPPLSSKPSTSSFSTSRQQSHLPDTSLSSLRDAEPDEWALKLGHANFHISPEPYMPPESTSETCKQLMEDWETARTEYLRQTVRVSEHYGPTSRIYQLTEEKWMSIDAQWRAFHTRAVAEAEANGDIPVFQPLAQHQPALSKIPSLNDSAFPSKFPRVEDAEIVGPMLQYAKVNRSVSQKKRKNNILRIFTDPASLFGRSPLTGLRQ